MKFTNKQLEQDFFEWAGKKSFIFKGIDRKQNFSDLPQSAQFGLIQEFADTKKIYITIDGTFADFNKNWDMWFNENWEPEDSNSRQEAQIKAFEQLNNIYE